MANILITGGCGFVGSNLAVWLSAQGHCVTAFDNLSRRGSEMLLRRILNQGVAFRHGDIRNPEDLERLAGDFSVMIECSAEPSVLVGTQGADARFMVNNNLVGSLNCFELARRRRMAVIFMSTSRVYPYDAINACSFRESATRFELAREQAGISMRGVASNFPLQGVRSLYGATKLASELILQEYGAQYDLPCVINRCGVIAGPWQLGKVDQGVFTFWLANHYFKKPLKYIGFGGHGKQVRDLLHIDDLLDLIGMQVERLEGQAANGPALLRGAIFNAGGSTISNLSLAETTALCRNITGNRIEIGSDPANRPADVIWYVTDNGDTQPVWGWQPKRTPEQILGDTFTWLREHESDFKQVLG